MPIKSEVIANTKSERVHRVSELADRKGRKRSGRFMVEGPQSVRELLTYHPGIVEDLYVEVESALPDASFATIRRVCAQGHSCGDAPYERRRARRACRRRHAGFP